MSVLKWIKIHVLYICIQASLGEKWRCCGTIPGRERFSQCKDACDELFISGGPLQELQAFSHVYRFCPLDSLSNFWQCIGMNYAVLSHVDIWTGRVCCELASSEDCKLSCISAMKKDDVVQSCSSSQEPRLLQCIDKQKGSAVCCSNIESPQCKAACRGAFASEYPIDDNLEENLNATCLTNPSSIDCVKRWLVHRTISSASSRSLECCERGSTSICRQTCIQSLTTLSNQDDVMEALQPVCSKQVSLEDPMWQCFLVSSHASINREVSQANSYDVIPMDGASLQCCSRAVSSSCQSLCIQRYSKRVSSVWEGFSNSCQTSMAEQKMNTCLQNVEAPCQVGCQDMQFCHNFNGRQTDLFSSCTIESDQAARNEFNKWLRERVIELHSLSVPLKDISSCEPETWKAIACTLQIKPCKNSFQKLKICRLDCVRILNKCSLSTDAVDVNNICDLLLASENDGDCINLSQFTSAVPSTPDMEISNPCIPPPCNRDEVCETNRNYPSCLMNNLYCLPYTCKSACPVGRSSPIHIKTNYYAMLAVNSSTSQPDNCYKICKCSHHGLLVHCQKTFCVHYGSCLVLSDTVIGHGEIYNSDCNTCICHSGETICSNKNCMDNTQMPHSSLSSLPCGCAATYDPVCTKNGRVFANSCLAKCSGFRPSTYFMGNCASRNPCGDSPCEPGYKCVPFRKTCLSANTICPQYECVSASCEATKHGHVCDSSGVQHTNICSLLANRRQIAYKGHCLTNCEHKDAVCGINGETYMNECSALMDRVPVDYDSPCRALPSQGHGLLSSCPDVACSKNIPDWCEPFTPAGACCPVCGAQVAVLYSKTAADRVTESMNDHYITTKDIAEHLRHFISSSSCDIFSYLSPEEELILLVLPTNQQFTAEEVKLCIVDATYIASMIEYRSPLLYSDAILSLMIASRVYSSRVSDFSAISSGSITPSTFSITASTLTMALTFY